MKPYSQLNSAEIRIEFQKRLVDSCVWQTCLNCTQFDIDADTCKRYNAKPPAYIILSGCKDHETDIPF